MFILFCDFYIVSIFFVNKSILGWCGKSVLFTIALTYTAFIINQTTSKLRDLKLWVNSDLGCLSWSLLSWLVHLWLGGSAAYHCKDMGRGRKEFMAIFSISANEQHEQAWASLVANDRQVKTRGNSLCRLQTAHHVNEIIQLPVNSQNHGGQYKWMLFQAITFWSVQLWQVALWLCCCLRLGFLGNRHWDEDSDREFSWDKWNGIG